MLLGIIIHEYSWSMNILVIKLGMIGELDSVKYVYYLNIIVHVIRYHVKVLICVKCIHAYIVESIGELEIG
jgi:hypothetical protein